MSFYVLWSVSIKYKSALRVLVSVLSTQTKSNFTSIKMMTRPPVASGYRFHHVTKRSIHWPRPCHWGAINFLNLFSCSPESDELEFRTQTRLSAWPQSWPVSPVPSGELQSRNSPPRWVTLTTLQYFHESVLRTLQVLNLSLSGTLFAKSSASMTGWLDKLFPLIFWPTWMILTSSEFETWISFDGRHAGTRSGMSLSSSARITAMLLLVIEDFCSHGDRPGCRIIFLTVMMTSWQNLISSP